MRVPSCLNHLLHSLPQILVLDAPRLCDRLKVDTQPRLRLSVPIEHRETKRLVKWRVGAIAVEFAENSKRTIANLPEICVRKMKLRGGCADRGIINAGSDVP